MVYARYFKNNRSTAAQLKKKRIYNIYHMVAFLSVYVYYYIFYFFEHMCVCINVEPWVGQAY